ncbi:ATP-binding protein [Streptomyces sp. SID4948]|nr:ATP-binding protein [Streptomyces sp. SID4948]
MAAARALATAFLSGQRDGRGRRLPPQVVVDVQLVVSELVTNAVKYAPGPCTLSLLLRGRYLEVSVADSAPEPPIPLTTEPGRVGRHGLEIVLALCVSFEFQHAGGGKFITVLVDLDAAAEAAS